MSRLSGDFAAYEAKLAAYDAHQAEAREASKDALFDALAAAGIAVVIVTFDGSRDSGQIDDMTAYDAAEMPVDTIGVSRVDFDTLAVSTARRRSWPTSGTGRCATTPRASSWPSSCSV